MKTAITVLSDLHINSTVGLCDRQVKLDDGGYYMPSTQQKFLLTAWESFSLWSSKIIGDFGAEQKVIVLNGDLVDLSKYSKHQMVTTNTNTVIDSAMNLIYPLRSSYDRLFVIRGTESHVGASGEMEETLARELKAEQDKITGLYSRWLMQVEANGILIDFAHHGRIGGKPWNRTSPLYNLVAEIVMEGMKNGTNIPDLVLRSHCHTFADTVDALPVRVIQTPCWQLNTAYSYRMGFVNKPDIGGLVILVNDDESYEIEVATYDIPPISPVRL